MHQLHLIEFRRVNLYLFWALAGINLNCQLIVHTIRVKQTGITFSRKNCVIRIIWAKLLIQLSKMHNKRFYNSICNCEYWLKDNNRNKSFNLFKFYFCFRLNKLTEKIPKLLFAAIALTPILLNGYVLDVYQELAILKLFLCDFTFPQFILIRFRILWCLRIPFRLFQYVVDVFIWI